jgi:phage-related protein
MASPTFNPSAPPQLGSGRELDERVNTAEFGDGYEQVTSDGLNAFRWVRALNWNGITQAEKEEIETFFLSVGRSKAWWYTPAGTVTPLKWRFSDKLSLVDLDGGPLYSGGVPVRQVFDPGD